MKCLNAVNCSLQPETHGTGMKSSLYARVFRWCSCRIEGNLSKSHWGPVNASVVIGGLASSVYK